METAVIGYPRIGLNRELKFSIEKYIKREINQNILLNQAKELRRKHWLDQDNQKIDFISSNDFSLYDNVLDTAFLLNIIPKRYQNLNLDSLDTYFAMARGYQGEQGDVKALAMKKWFNTNYHYLVPEIDDHVQIKLNGTKIFDEFIEAKQQNIKTKPVIIGPYTLIKLSHFIKPISYSDIIEKIIQVYIQIIEKFNNLNAEWFEFDEPALGLDMDDQDIILLKEIYTRILNKKGKLKILLQTYFGDLRDCYNEVMTLDFDGIGLDFIEGKQTLSLLKTYGFNKNKVLFAGVINGKNIWKDDYSKTVKLLDEVKKITSNMVISTSCSLLHVPYTIENEPKIDREHKRYFAFAKEKLIELFQLKVISKLGTKHSYYIDNTAVFNKTNNRTNKAVQERLARLKESDFVRLPELLKRRQIQKEYFNLPILPTTTIGSFPQTKEVRANRKAYRKGEIKEINYHHFNQEMIKKWIKYQEEMGLDVLVHGEFERNDMVEYFGEKLEGYLFTENGWVQSYGTRCVKPPVIWSDVYRNHSLTVDYAVFSQGLTNKPVKGMVTGPVTMLNWSFPRLDISLKEIALQLALAIKDEVLELETKGIKIIQIDEAALREKLPLRKGDWQKEYLDWAIPAYRLVSSSVQPDTQIHSHMCYSEFDDIIQAIEDMDSDVISFEASRSNLSLLETLSKVDFKSEVGPGLYDIHSPRVPTIEEFEMVLTVMLEKLPIDKLWVNPDCGLKTRGYSETLASLTNMVQATKNIRTKLQ
ncbi:5-methyltetrahydropteroyltriglutamate--homocysteine S-methyltransferase [Thomasclavelia sp.]